MRLRGNTDAKGFLLQQPSLVEMNPESRKGKWGQWFGNENPIYVELGMGKGQFISEMSERYPDVNFIGIDRYDLLVYKAFHKAVSLRGDAGGIHNLALVRANIEEIGKIFDEDELTRIFLNFSDPWPKTRHARRRLTHPGFLEKYAYILNEDGEIHFKTDSVSLFEFSLNAFSDCDLKMQNISLDLHRDGTPPDHVMTEYEQKFVKKGMPIHRCEVLVGSRVSAMRRRKLGESDEPMTLAEKALAGTARASDGF